ncbi:hypothetical protein EVAR_79211_1 [Eumeta japonica]|uniref:Uncharacterized protein n=1 Tax=Eumeta variegata TaxID=151549 RepID=A0A4C1UUJ0_EUMVA|nr:hypothetical protein EVAR_79211_1 [Eumeta japonica]
MDDHNLKEVTGALQAFWEEIGYMMEEGVDHRNSHSLDETQQGKLFLQVCICESAVCHYSSRLIFVLRPSWSQQGSTTPTNVRILTSTRVSQVLKVAVQQPHDGQSCNERFLKGDRSSFTSNDRQSLIEMLVSCHRITITKSPTELSQAIGG